MAADLQGLLQDQSILTSIGEVGTSINHYIDTRFPGRQHMPSKGWTTNHESRPFRLSDDAYNTYSAWAASKGVIPITRHQLLCSKLQKGSLVYQPHSHSVGNSHILFRARASSTPLPGRIESILMEPSQAVPAGGTPRITMLVLRFQPLSRQDQFYDPYSQHPIVGASGYDIIQLCYEKFDPSAFIIEPDDIICHLARCDFDDVEEKLSAPCVVLVSLDLKHTI
ncbi:hypothetical protein FRC08_011664 [Ceratobasidium sp. 394]|nr:hypothetical protein FRC08_011664 [Ceratobasidium sp. 394]